VLVVVVGMLEYKVAVILVPLFLFLLKLLPFLELKLVEQK
jgi:hypothetical protein